MVLHSQYVQSVLLGEGEQIGVVIIPLIITPSDSLGNSSTILVSMPEWEYSHVLHNNFLVNNRHPIYW